LQQGNLDTIQALEDYNELNLRDVEEENEEIIRGLEL